MASSKCGRNCKQYKLGALGALGAVEDRYRK
jgi:hypothetical protein